MQPPVSLKNVADEAGVSISLVSKVLNNRMGNTKVTEPVAQKVRETAERMGYRKNASAEALRAGRQNVIGVVLHRHGEAGSPLIENLLLGFSEIARENGLKLMLHFFENAGDFHNFTHILHRGHIDGLLMGGYPHEELQPAVLKIKQGGVPVVTLFEDSFFPGIPNVGMNQIEVGELATRHLLEQGCQSIGIIHSHVLRLQGYRDAMKTAGIDIDPEWIFSSRNHFDYTTGEEAAMHWIHSGRVPDGIVGESDLHALAAINTLVKQGYRVPEDVKVTGMDNSPYCQYVRPSITSVSQENYQRGKKALQTLLRIQDGIRPDPKDAISPELFVRGSTVAHP